MSYTNIFITKSTKVKKRKYTVLSVRGAKMSQRMEPFPLPKEHNCGWALLENRGQREGNPRRLHTMGVRFAGFPHLSIIGE